MENKNQTIVEEIIDIINQIKMYRHSEDAKQPGGRGTGYVLSYLYYNGDKVLPSELSKMMNVTTPRVTAILNELEAGDLIIRSISPEDRRNVYVMLSDKGNQVVQQKLLQQQKSIHLLAERLDVEDVKAFLRVLKVLEKIIAEKGWSI
ncbi:MAG: winged helix-turn-helix transcriptional regulator [Clostridiaceae bacterium]|nr:winged helix-turn-helix transcriptional regulator [Clostridiaceae bacterium]